MGTRGIKEIQFIIDVAVNVRNGTDYVLYPLDSELDNVSGLIKTGTRIGNSSNYHKHVDELKQTKEQLKWGGDVNG